MFWVEFIIWLFLLSLALGRRMSSPLFWTALAWVLGRRPVADWLIRRAKRTPYTHLYGYMNRWWLFNAWDDKTHVLSHPWCPFSIRIHHILRADADRHCHSHPWAFRTIILKGWYWETRGWSGTEPAALIARGQTATLAHGEYHSIRRVPPEGVWTLFITGRKQSSWGFAVDGRHVSWRDYEARKDVVDDHRV